MGDYQVGGGLRLFTALEKTKAFAEFLQDRMILALETQDPAELRYLLAQVDDYHSFMWRYYRQLSKERGERSDPGAYPPRIIHEKVNPPPSSRTWKASIVNDKPRS